MAVVDMKQFRGKEVPILRSALQHLSLPVTFI